MPFRHLVVLLLFLLGLSAYGQDKAFQDRTAIGFQLGQYQRDFAVGAQLSSPYFGGRFHMAVRAQFNVAWLDHLDPASLETTWTAYRNGRLGVVFGTPVQGGFFRYYGEAGILVVFPDEAFSTSDNELGGYGLFGFEFLFNEGGLSGRAFFFELGGVGTGANADKVPGNPIYSNGLILNAGVRFHLGGKG
ncbi:MAG: hypothetical protein KDB96_09735 [Flavobacteriales bacterium]|nr:hypothetical protein [Flavobacteriales bacterium]